MRPTTWNTFGATMQPWLNGRFINTLPYVFGGWEAWIQADLVAYLNLKQGSNPQTMFDIERESSIPYNNGARCDWLINRNTVDQLHPPIIVEIKAQTPAGTGAGFLSGVRGDIAQLAAANLAPGYTNATRIALAFTIEPTVTDTLINVDGMVGFASLAGIVSVLSKTVVV